MSDVGTQPGRRLYRTMKRTCEAYALLEDGDRVMVAMSGGKDSYTLLDLLRALVPRLPFSVELVAVHLDQGQPGYDGTPLERWLVESGVRFEIVREDTYSVVTEKLDPGATYCALCSRLRRGVLYDAAERLGCTKIALGHHRDDALETLLMNLFFAGKLQAMPAKYRTDCGRFDVIRPLVECPEPVIRAHAEERAFPILPCTLCGSQPNLMRDRMTELMDEIGREHPDVRAVMANALKNVRATHLLDRALLGLPEEGENAARDEHPRRLRVV
jgi:tRNA 2-thiocytidine biosynthesis protein TtcA